MIAAVLIFALLAGLFGLVLLMSYPPLQAKIQSYLNIKTRWATGELDAMFLDVPQKKISLLFLIGPLAGGGLAFAVTHKLVMALGGCAVGAIIPQLWIMRMKGIRRKKFDAQLVDALMLLSSSLKAGLSITQSFEVMVEEMPAPISQEFGLVLKENKMGMALNDSFERLRHRMLSDDLNLVLTAIMVARETGGDVTEVFARLVETIRQRRQTLEKVKSLTFMGRLQAIVMTGLPIVFAGVILRMQPGYFKMMLSDSLGKLLLVYAVGSWFVGAVLMFLFSRIKV